MAEQVDVPGDRRELSSDRRIWVVGPDHRLYLLGAAAIHRAGGPMEPRNGQSERNRVAARGDVTADEDHNRRRVEGQRIHQHRQRASRPSIAEPLTRDDRRWRREVARKLAGRTRRQPARTRPARTGGSASASAGPWATARAARVPHSRFISTCKIMWKLSMPLFLGRSVRVFDDGDCADSAWVCRGLVGRAAAP
jgi:hypothetical protein